MVVHEGQRVPVKLTREKFDELTEPWLGRTLMFTKETINEASKRGCGKFDQILLVGGSTRMPQVRARLESEFGLPMQILEPDEAVAKGASIYAQSLLISEKIKYEVAQALNTTADDVSVDTAPAIVVQRAQEQVARESGLRLDAVEKFNNMSIVNVASHSFGVVAWTKDLLTGQEKQVISNIIRVNDPVPASPTRSYGTYETNQESVELEVYENTQTDENVEDLSMGIKLGESLLPLPIRLPQGSPIEVTFELNQEGRLNITGREPSSGSKIEAQFQTKSVVSEEETSAAKSRRVVIS